MTHPLPVGELSDAPIRVDALQALYDLIELHIAERRYPGAQIALEIGRAHV